MEEKIQLGSHNRPVSWVNAEDKAIMFAGLVCLIQMGEPGGSTSYSSPQLRAVSRWDKNNTQAFIPDFYLKRLSESLSRALRPFEDLFPAPWFPVEGLRDQPICSSTPPLHLEAACLLLFKTLLFLKSVLPTHALPLVVGRRLSSKHQGSQVKFVLIGRSHTTKGKIPCKWDLFCIFLPSSACTFFL